MSIASGIRAALTSWWAFNGSVTDSKGVNTLDANLTIAGYSAGKSGQKLDEGSRGSKALASTIALSPTTGRITLGGWLHYDGVATSSYVMGLARHLAAGTQEVISIFAAAGVFSVLGWKDNGVTTYLAEDSGVRKTAYPITVQAQDSAGQIATSDQVIRISTGDPNPAGAYFLVAVWDEGLLKLYVDTALVDQVLVDAVYTSPIAYFQVGSVGYGLSGCGLEDCFLLSGKALTAEEITFLYNNGDGMTYAQLLAAT